MQIQRRTKSEVRWAVNEYPEIRVEARRLSKQKDIKTSFAMSAKLRCGKQTSHCDVSIEPTWKPEKKNMKTHSTVQYGRLP